MAITPFSEIPIDNLEGVLIDLDDTLYDYKSAHPIAIEKCFLDIENKLDMNLRQFSDLYRSQRTAVTEQLQPTGACRSRLLAFQGVFEILGFAQPYLVAQRQTEVYWSELISAAKPDEEALKFLQRCRTANLKVCVVTDMLARVQVMKLEGLGLASYIDQLVSSEESGSEKPAALMFELGLKKLGLGPDQVIMVGDSAEKDIAGAEALGIKAYQVSLR